MRKFNTKPGTTPGGPCMRRLVLPALAVSAGLLLGPGCDRDQVSHASVAKEAAPAMPAPSHASAPMAMPPGAMPPGSMPGGQLPPPPHPTGKGALKWTLPKGWTEAQGGGMRYATLTPPGAGKVEMSVVVLPGAAGGELANVNRWRGQIGLQPLDDAALGQARKAVKSKAGPVSVYDFTSAGETRTRMVTGLLATAEGNTWFFKLMGDAEPVGKAKPAFMKYLETLHLD